MSLPVVDLVGTPQEQGFVHGQELKARVAHNVALYFNRFEREIDLPRAEVLEIAARYGAAIEQQNPDYYAGMQGIAEGSGFSFLEIVALNVRYEILYYQYGKKAIALAAEKDELPGDGCTAFAVLPTITESGHLLMGQNWDWIPEVQGAVLHTTDAEGFETLAYTECGIYGAKIGLNTNGLGLAINGMTSMDDDWERLAKPFHVRCYEILRSRSMEDAIGVIASESRSCSTNFLIAQVPDLVTDVEAAPDIVNLLNCTDECLTHANHFVDPASIGVTQTPNPRMGFSVARQARLRELLLAATPLTIEKIETMLQDTQNDPFGLCRHRDLTAPPSDHYTTVTSVVMDLNTRTIHLTDGAPDEAPYQTVALG